MKIVFNALKSGLGNNGGTKTIIRSAETLKAIGHDVEIVARINLYTWHSSSIPIVDRINRFDVCIAVSDMDIDGQLPNTHSWVRSWALWNSTDSVLKEKYATVKCIANSSWLANYLNCDLCYSGIDLHRWSELPIRCSVNNNCDIGYLNHGRHKTKNSLICFDVAKQLDCDSLVLDSDANFNDQKLRQIYNGCNIWLAPTELEGFHNVPAEANLCGCLVVCLDNHRNGMGDYATEETAHVCRDSDECVEAIKNPDYSKVSKMQNVLRKKIGDREKNMGKFVELL